VPRGHYGSRRRFARCITRLISAAPAVRCGTANQNDEGRGSAAQSEEKRRDEARVCQQEIIVMPPVPDVRGRQMSAPFDPADPAGRAARSAARRAGSPLSRASVWRKISSGDLRLGAGAPRLLQNPQPSTHVAGVDAAFPGCRSSRLEPECRRAEPRSLGSAHPRRPAHPRRRASPRVGGRAAEIGASEARAAAAHLALLP